MNVRRRKAMQKLFLVALVVGVCTPALMAQDPAKAGIYGALQSARFNAPESNRQDADFNSRDAAGATAEAAAPGGGPRCRGCSSGHTHVEIYGGYSILLFDGLETNNVDINDVLNQRIHFHGAELSGTFNFSRYVGAQFDFSIHRRSEGLDQFGLAGDAEANIQHFLFGVQVKNNSKDGTWFRPFGHFLAGFSKQKLDFNSPLLTPVIGGDTFSFRKNSFALNMGGGIDVRITDVFSIRPIKLDYLPVFVDDFDAAGVTFTKRTQRNLRAGAGLVFHF
jgi:opacity protein-like surface antigen